jgi:nucleoside-diphosphate-sugar epimerase
MVLNKNYIGVTGASGLLGRHVITYLLKKKYKIIATSRRKPPVAHKNLVWKKLDLRKKIEFSKLNKIYKNINSLIHIGATVPFPGKIIKKREVNITNVNSSVILAKWSRFSEIHFILISGAVLYKEKFKKNTENAKTLIKSKNIYINSKIFCEKKILSLKKYFFKLTIIRASSLYGEGMNEKKVIPIMIKKAKKNKPIKIFNYKDTKINLIHAKDISSAIYKIINNSIYGVFNLGSKKCVNFNDLAISIIKKLKSKSEIINENKRSLLAPINPMNININLAKKKLRWEPRISLKEGIKMMVNKKCF